MAASVIKYDDGAGGYATNCFPVRTLVQHPDEGSYITLVISFL